MKKQIQRLSTVLAAVAVSLAALSSMTWSAQVSAAPLTCNWTGAGGSNKNFSLAANWSNCGGVAPANGSNLVFDDTAVTGAEIVPLNDISNLTVGSVAFTGSNPTYSFQIDGNPLTITGGITDSTSSVFPTGFVATVIVSGNQTLTTTHTYDTYLASVQGAGNLTINGAGDVLIADLSSYTGTISSSTTNVKLESFNTFTSSGSVAISGNAALTLINESARDADTVFNLPLSLGGNGITHIGPLNLVGQGNGDSITLPNTLTLTSDIVVTADGNTTLNINGHVNYNGHTISSVGQKVTTINVAQGTDRSSDNPGIGSNVTYANDGRTGNATVASGGLLSGNGTLASLLVKSGGVVSPGHSPGCLTVSGNFTLAGSYIQQIQDSDATACTNYDQVKVGGAIDLSGATLNVSLLNNFTPAVNQVYTIIANQNGAQVLGAFAGLPQNTVFQVGSTKFLISYKGIGNNNVVLTVVNPTTPLGVLDAGTPDTGFAAPKSLLNPVVVFMGFTVAASIIYLAGRHLMTRARQ